MIFNDNLKNNMFKITIKGEAYTDHANLSDLHGIDCQDNFADYFDRDFSFNENIKSGYMSFEYDSENDKLVTITEYNSDRKLTEEELDVLSEYTQGQWSDGIGEGFEQEPCSYGISGDEEIYISAWHVGQEIVVTQEEKN